MANITFDFSNEEIVHPQGSNNIKFTYKDLGTGNIRYYVDPLTKKEHINAIDSSNLDAAAIKASLNNILNFRTGDEILDPEFGIGKVYEMLYTPFDKYVAQKMIKIMKDIIATYEPRIEVTAMPIEYNEDKQEFSITIHYYVPALSIDDSYQIVLTK